MPALLIAERNTARKVPELQMRCDKTEFADVLGDPKPDWWVAEMAAVEGQLPWLGNNAAPLNGVSGICSIAIRGGQFAAIVAPADLQIPAAWLAADLTQCQVQAEGSQGMFRKRPTAIDIQGDGWGLTLGRVSRVYRSGGGPGRYQTGQEGSLLAALTGRG
jgi:hypothetical protein